MPEMKTAEEEQTENVFFFRWNTNDLEIKTRTVEKTLQPLVMQVTTLVNTDGVSHKKKGKSKKAHVLVAAVEAATANFIERGKEIARDTPQIRKEMLEAVEDVSKSGELMSSKARDFAADPCTSSKRQNMVKAARQLLGAVTRLLILADLVDVHRLLRRLSDVEQDLERIKNSSSQAELEENFRRFAENANDLLNQAARRQRELMDPRLQDDLASARATLKKSTAMLFTASKAYIRHPELAEARDNRDYVLKEVREAVEIIKNVAQGIASGRSLASLERAGELESALEAFDGEVVIDPATFNEAHSRVSLEDQLESIISGAALLADSPSTRNDRRHRIIDECDALRGALQDLLTEYMDNMGRKETSDSLDQALGHIHGKTQDLRRQLRKAVVDHVSDRFVDSMLPLIALVEAAKKGDAEEANERAQDFAEYAKKIVEVANLACSMSSNEEGVKMVRYATMQAAQLYPQVINAAKILAIRHTSKVAQDNLEAFKEAWENQLRILMDSVDDITTIDDFLAVSESHILEDVKICVQAINDGDYETFDRVSRAIQGRSNRICDVVTAEMDNFMPCAYTDRVLEAVAVLRQRALPNFKERAAVAAEALGSDPAKDIDENDFIDASYIVHESVRDIRQAVLINKSDDELDPEEVYTGFPSVNDLRSSMYISMEEQAVIDEYPEVSEISTARDAMRNLSDQDKDRIAAEVENFQAEKEKFDKEVLKWDDTGNDLIALAKYISVIMLRMTDFTRGKGPLKTTMDVIDAAKKISSAGTKMDKLARDLADKCPDSRTKNDILAYLDRIALYCHQLNITSNVKADVTSISGNLIVSGLDSATSLIQAAKNLMSAVVLTVKSSYVASTVTKRSSRIPGERGIVWRMKAPEKKPLVRRNTQENIIIRGQKAPVMKKISVAEFLKDFQEEETTIQEDVEEDVEEML